MLPSSGHVIGERRPRSDFPRQAEVAELDELRAVAQHVLRLEIAVKEAVLVHVSQALQYLDDDLLERRLGQRLFPVESRLLRRVTQQLRMENSPALVALLHQLIKILFHVLEHEEQRLVLADHLLQLDDVLVAQLFQRLSK